jgi:anion-transporting  ArsA/GET3 family ATPase
MDAPMKQEIHFVSGKGGVGKSIVAAALALKKSREGRKVLLVELGDQSFYQDFFGLSSVGFAPKELKPNLAVALWSGEACLREYATYLIKVESLAKLFFENSVMSAFVNIAPALPELAILGKITSGPRKHGPPLPYDCIVVDAFATGHFIALMEAPKGMASAVQFGPMGEQSRSIDKCLRDQELCKYHIVTLPEELPVKESVELTEKLKSEFNVDPEIIMNKVLVSPVDNKTLEKVQDEKSDLSEFARYVHFQVDRQKEMIKKAQAAKEKVSMVPLFFEMDPWKITELIAGKLT